MNRNTSASTSTTLEKLMAGLRFFHIFLAWREASYVFFLLMKRASGL